MRQDIDLAPILAAMRNSKTSNDAPLDSFSWSSVAAIAKWSTSFAGKMLVECGRAGLIEFVGRFKAQAIDGRNIAIPYYRLVNHEAAKNADDPGAQVAVAVSGDQRRRAVRSKRQDNNDPPKRRGGTGRNTGPRTDARNRDRTKGRSAAKAVKRRSPRDRDKR